MRRRPAPCEQADAADGAARAAAPAVASGPAGGRAAGAGDGLLWVGIGASAGGLEAICEIVRRLEPTGRALFVVAQHTSPTHKSLLTELIARQTALRVVELGEAPVAPVADVIYVAPANADVVVERGALRLRPTSAAPGAPKPSVNRLFLSMAHELGERAVAAVLSGTGSDGAYGVEAVRAAGGFALAQDPRTAKYDGMPLAAIRTGCVDLVLAPETMAARLTRLAATPRPLAASVRPEAADRTLDDLLDRLRAAHGVDFGEYKPAMVQRRVERRVAALGFESLSAYVAHAWDSAAEIEALFRDLMISVTSFFRDGEEFEALGGLVAARLADATEEPFRIWTAGCATGEEAYSLLILVAEALGGPDRLAARRVSMFATDIDEAALQRARRGVYPKEAFDRMAPARRAAFFEPHPDGFAACRALREAVVFSRHNLAQDPPFRRIDLIACRNVLIYFGPDLQARVLAALRYALKPDGLLFLGKAETAAASPDAFWPIRGNQRILGPNALAPPALAAFGDRRASPPRAGSPRSAMAPADLGAARAERALFDSLARALGGDCLLVSEDLRVRRCYGAISRYMDPSDGDFGVGVDRLLRPARRREAVSLIQLAFRAGRPVDGSFAAPPDEPLVRERMRAVPLDPGDAADRLVLLAFERRAVDPSEAEAAGRIAASPEAARLAALEAALDAKQRSLSMTVEELETANEELQTLNEELQSTNEELQSANEELQTANEELQSSNEELTTVNEELQIRGAELTAAAANLRAVLAHIATAVVVVDTRLRVAAASAAARGLFALSDERLADGPPVETCREPEGFPRLADLFRECLARRERLTRDADCGERFYTVVVSPYAATGDALAGAVAVVADETERRDRTASLQSAMDKLRASNAELERFSYVASHDLKEPVRTLAGYADFLADPAMRLDEAESRAMVAAMRDNARRLGEIIDGLLAFSRIDREVQIEAVDLGQIAREAVDVLSRVILDAGAVVDLRPLPTVRASRVHMRQLLQNLIGNAVKFRGAEPCRIVVSAAEGRDPVISVEDNGPGVPPEARESVFDVFSRLRPRDDVDGAGLGLSICRKIVEQYHGRIWCDDSVLGGAAFRFTLPGV